MHAIDADQKYMFAFVAATIVIVVRKRGSGKRRAEHDKTQRDKCNTIFQMGSPLGLRALVSQTRGVKLGGQCYREKKIRDVLCERNLKEI
jgi:hypothetical protein